MAKRWFEGSADPLDMDKVEHGDWVKRRPNPRSSEGERPVFEQTVEHPEVTHMVDDPLEILIRLEEGDEEERAVLIEYHTSLQITKTTSRKGNT